jgi:NAD(P) transhydrogenase subunit beta
MGLKRGALARGVVDHQLNGQVTRHLHVEVLRNPAARSDQSSPIYGMPILDVDKARTAMVIKRSMSPGFAGIDNELYHLDKTLMLFGDARSFVGDIVKELAAGGH